MHDIDVQPNGSPLNNSPSSSTGGGGGNGGGGGGGGNGNSGSGGGNHGPSYASAVKAGTSDDDQ